jgi:uncharacterized membrane protein YcaP (DUF421 family)
MNHTLVDLFGTGTELSATQMALRALAVFALTLLMIRVSGRRSLGQHSSFDVCITVLLGSVLSRAVVGASPFWPTIAAGFALVLLHRAIGMLSALLAGFDVLVNGRPRTLVLEGNIDQVAMRKGLVATADLLQALREESVPEDPARVKRMVLERNGRISILKR